MRAYHLAMALIIFTLSLPVVASLGFQQPSGGQSVGTSYLGKDIWDWGGLLSAGLPLFAVGIIATLIGFKMNIGAIVFAAVFTVSQIPFAGTLGWLHSTHNINTSLVGTLAPSNLGPGLIWIVVQFVFVFAFIQLSSVPTETD